MKVVGRYYCLVVSALVFVIVFALPVVAQELPKMPLIGYLSSASRSGALFRTQPFRQSLHELGYTEGKNILIEYRYAEGKTERLPALAAELVRLKV